MRTLLIEPQDQREHNPSYNDLRQALIWVLENIEAATHKVSASYSGSTNRKLPRLDLSPSGQQTSARAKRRHDSSGQGTERIIARLSPRSSYPQIIERLSTVPSGQDGLDNSAEALPSQPSYPISSLPDATPVTVASRGASLRKDKLIRTSTINHPPHVLPPIVPIKPTTAVPLPHFQNNPQKTNREPLGSKNRQDEYDNLLSAVSQAQTRVAILGRKCKAYEAEVSSLTKERSILTARIKSLEAHLQEVQQSRDEAQRQSVAKGAQYVDIMAMASKIQAQGDLDAQKWKAEKDNWQQERQSLLQKLAILQHQKEASFE